MNRSKHFKAAKKANQDNGSGQTKNGIVKEFFKDGTLSCAGRCRDGTKIGEWKYYLRNGALKAVGKYADGKLNGPWKWYRETGKLMQTGSFDHEKRVGLWKRYHPNGMLFDEGEYDGEKQSANGAPMTPKENCSRRPGIGRVKDSRSGSGKGETT